ncbi:hypothetical protein [Nocardia sp. R7R-8]|uniref:hypothetical protein n=1 Tax=Nocardia sp. R7R-8 TaxID=3459304 RepID=UPI00403D808F
MLADWSDRQDQVELTTRLAQGLLTAQAGGTPPAEAAVERVAAAMRARTPISSDHKAQTIELMLVMWMNITPLIANWKWALYRSESLLKAVADCVTGNYYSYGTATLYVPAGYTSQNNRTEFASELTHIDC